MPDREEVAARLAAAVLQSTPEPSAKRPGQAPDMLATCRHAVAVYETILGMLPMPQPGKTASRKQPAAGPHQASARRMAPRRRRRGARSGDPVSAIDRLG
jgi:hypothetical protein